MNPTSRPRPDASMTLLTEVMERPLDPGYALAAARRAGRRPHRFTVLVSVLSTAVIALACGLIATVAVLQLRRPVPGSVATRRALEAELQRRTEHADQTQRANAALRRQLAQARSLSLAAPGGRGSDLAEQVDALGRVAGELPVSGAGIEVRLDDAPGLAGSGTGQRGRVIDRDLQVVVNGLWAAGAQAVAVNGYRLSALSAIRSAGEAVLVDFQPLIPPYRVQAIGDPRTLQNGLVSGMAGPYLEILRRDGIRSAIGEQARLDLPGATDTSRLRFARPVPDAAPTPSGSSSGGVS